MLVNNYKSILAVTRMKEALARQNSATQLAIAGHTKRARPQYLAGAELFDREFDLAARNITEPGEESIVADIKAQYILYRQDVGRFLLSVNEVHLSDPSSVYSQRLQSPFIALQSRLKDLLRLNEQSMLGWF